MSKWFNEPCIHSLNVSASVYTLFAEEVGDNAGFIIGNILHTMSIDATPGEISGIISIGYVARLSDHFR